MVLPNFIVIGAAKAGTSSLHYYLSQHPEIYMSPLKEPRFFALEGERLNFQNPDQSINHTSITTLANYQALFEGVTNESAIGEASPLYLSSNKACNRIHHYIPDVKLIAILRNPVDRAFSCYTHLLREGYEKLSFEEALAEEEHRVKNNWAHLWHYAGAGFYYPHLKEYFETFNHNQIKIYLYEEFNQNSTEIVRDICRFLKVSDDFQPDLTRVNVSGIPKSRLLHNFFVKKNILRTAIQQTVPTKLRKTVARSLKNQNLGKKPTLNAETRRKLIELYRSDILSLESLIDRQLSHWLVVEQSASSRVA